MAAAAAVGLTEVTEAMDDTDEDGSPGRRERGGRSPLSRTARMRVSPHGSSVCIASCANASGAGDGSRDRRLRARLVELAATRRSPRRGHGAVLSFLCAGDGNGLFRYLGGGGSGGGGGGGGGGGDFFNPARSGAVDVTASSPASRGGTSPTDVASVTFNRTNFAGPARNPRTGETEGGWWRVDLGPNKSLRCDYYAARRNGEAAEVLCARRVRGRRKLVDVTEALGRRRAGDAGGLGRVAGAAAGERALVSVPAREADGEHGDRRRGVGVEASAVQPGVLRRALDEEELKSRRTTARATDHAT